MITMEIKGNLCKDPELFEYKGDTIVAMDIASNSNDGDPTLYIHTTKKFEVGTDADAFSKKFKKGAYVFARGMYRESISEVKDKKTKVVTKYTNRNLYAREIYLI